MICLIYSHVSNSATGVAPSASVRIGDVVVVGRQFDCDLSVEDDHMSRRHFMVDATEQGFRVRDLGSMNGTLLNGVPVTIAPLCSGDRLRAGNTYFTVQMQDSDVRTHQALNRPDPYRGAPTRASHESYVEHPAAGSVAPPHHRSVGPDSRYEPPQPLNPNDPHHWMPAPYSKPIDRYNPMQRLEIADHPSVHEPTVRLDPREIGRLPSIKPAPSPNPGGRPVVTRSNEGPPPPKYSSLPPLPASGRGAAGMPSLASSEASAPTQAPAPVQAPAPTQAQASLQESIRRQASSAATPAPSAHFEMAGLRQVVAKVPDGLEDFQVRRLRDLVAGYAFLLVGGQQRAKELCGLLGEHYRTGLVINRAQLDGHTAGLLEYLAGRGAAQSLSETIYWAEFNPADDMLAQLCRQATGLDAAVCLGFRQNDPPAAEVIAELCHLLCYPSLLLDALTRYGSEDAVLLFRKIVFLIFEKDSSGDLYLFTEPGFQTHGTWVEGALLS